MQKEYSAGAIIFRQERGCPLYLIIYSGRNKVWGFPKGHTESGESEIDTAPREIQEETGLNDLVLLSGFREVDIYQAVSNRGPNNGNTIEKHSVYFLCETKPNDVIVDAHEITDHKWLCMHEAEKLLSFDSLKRVLRKAHVLACCKIPSDAIWHEVAVSHKIVRYMLDVSSYNLPYYEIRYYGLECFSLFFVYPNEFLSQEDPLEDQIDDDYGPYGCPFKAIKADSLKRGLPAKIEGKTE